MHITQSQEWADFKKSTGVAPVKLESGSYVYFSPVPRLPFTIGYCPRPETLNMEELFSAGKQHHSVFIKVDPNLIIDSSLSTVDCRPSTAVLPQHTFILDLTPTESEILKGMDEKTRYNIKIAQKHGVIIRKASSLNDIQVFCDLQRETAKRQRFRVKPDCYFLSMWEQLHPKNLMEVLIAEYEGKSIAAIALLFYQDTMYYAYGGSAEIHRETMPNYLLHYEAIKIGRERKMKNYDLWGAYKLSPEEKDPWFGIYRFKKGFGGQLLTYPQSFDIIFHPLFYFAYQLFSKRIH